MSKVYRVKNRGASTVVYRIPEDGVRREFKPGQTLPISSEELEKLTYQPGGTVILSQFLQILDLEGLEHVNLHPEPEYHYTDAELIQLIKSGSLDAFLDTLDFAPIGVIDMLKKLSLEVPLIDMPKRKALKEKTGFDVEAALKHQEEDREDEQTTILKQSDGKRRVQPAAAPTGRRTTPKYNVTSIQTPAEAAEV